MAACAANGADPESSTTDENGDALGTEAQALNPIPCKVDCDCPLDDVCSIATGATSGSCVLNPAHGFGPQPPDPICVGNCQCAGQPSGPYCVNGACKAAVPIVPVSGSWYNPARSGWGLALSNDLYGSKNSGMYGDINLVWYTYTANGAPIWYSSMLEPNGQSYTGVLYSIQYVPASQSTSATQRGTVNLVTTSKTKGTFSWVLDGKPGSEPVQYMAFGGSGSTPPVTGQWFAYTPCAGCPLGEIPIDLNMFFDVQGSTAVSYVGLYDSSGQPTWVYGSAATSSTAFTVSLLRITGINLSPGSVGVPSSSYQQEGSLTVQNINAAGSSAKFSLTLPASYLPHVASTQWISRRTN